MNNRRNGWQTHFVCYFDDKREKRNGQEMKTDLEQLSDAGIALEDEHKNKSTHTNRHVKISDQV